MEAASSPAQLRLLTRSQVTIYPSMHLKELRPVGMGSFTLRAVDSMSRSASALSKPHQWLLASTERTAVSALFLLAAYTRKPSPGSVPLLH